MRAAARVFVAAFERRGERRGTKRSPKFSIVKHVTKGNDELRLDDGRIDWTEGQDDSVPDLRVAGVRVPEDSHHFITDPAGYKGKRDQRLIERIEKWQKRDKLRKFQPTPAVVENPDDDGMSFRQRRLSSVVLNALNEILEDEVLLVPDPSTGGKLDLVAPVIHNAHVRFVRVEMTKDLLRARCFWECDATYEVEVRNTLSQLKPQIRQILTEKKMVIKLSPKLEFLLNNRKAADENLDRLMEVIDAEIAEGAVDPKDITDKEKYLNDVMERFAEISGEFVDQDRIEADDAVVSIRRLKRMDYGRDGY